MEIHQQLPPEAVPFVRDLLLEVSRRIPLFLTPSPRFPDKDLADPAQCVQAAGALLGWLEVSQDTLGRRAEELEGEFVSLLGVVEQIEAGVHRAVLHARRWVEEDMTFSHSVREALCLLDGTSGRGDSMQRAAAMVPRILERFEAKERADRAESMALSSQFDGVERELGRLRERIARVEEWTRALRDRSLRDDLTGLWNRRACEERLLEEVSRAERYASSVSVALWDVDRLKAVNEDCGHRAGDRVLQTLARRALSMLRRSDFLARYEGGEFAAIFPSAGAPQVLMAGQKLRALVESEAVPTPVGLVQVTASVGVASWRPGDTAETLLSAAEEALRIAKSSGRNRVEGADPARPSPGRAT